uniref:hypothetical protein n=1 Tax=Prevotella sp. TaxID=59823 RepID=UPI0040278506
MAGYAVRNVLWALPSTGRLSPCASFPQIRWFRSIQSLSRASIGKDNSHDLPSLFAVDGAPVFTKHGRVHRYHSRKGGSAMSYAIDKEQRRIVFTFSLLAMMLFNACTICTNEIKTVEGKGSIIYRGQLSNAPIPYG